MRNGAGKGLRFRLFESPIVAFDDMDHSQPGLSLKSQLNGANLCPITLGREIRCENDMLRMAVLHNLPQLQSANSSPFTINRLVCRNGSLRTSTNARRPESLARPVLDQNETLRGVQPFLYHQFDNFVAREGKNVRHGIDSLGELMIERDFAGVPGMSGGNEQSVPHFPRHHQRNRLVQSDYRLSSVRHLTSTRDLCVST